MRRRLVLLVVAPLGLVAVLGASGLSDSLVYYRTPTEVAADPALATERVRVGGLVLPGTVRRDGATVQFLLTDGVRDVAVAYVGEPPGVFQEGQGALVEGQLGPDGTLNADTILVKHSNEYSSEGRTATAGTAS